MTIFHRKDTQHKLHDPVSGRIILQKFNKQNYHLAIMFISQKVDFIEEHLDSDHFDNISVMLSHVFINLTKMGFRKKFISQKVRLT